MEQINLIQLLADGKFHSGEDLGKSLSISRAAIWKQIKALENVNLQVDSVKGKGYRLSEPLELLNREKLFSVLNENTKDKLSDLKIFSSIDSTNQALLDAADNGDAKSGAVYLSEYQSAGRGRRGRQWVSPFGSNLYCSILWEYEKGLAALEGLSLIVGLSIVEALDEIGISDLKLKWPNDILANGKKLAGILLEVSGEVDDQCKVVIGFGVNFYLNEMANSKIDQEWTDLRKESHQNIQRNIISGKIIENVIRNLSEFENNNFSNWTDSWNKRDAYSGKHVSILIGNKTIKGVCRGVNEQGAVQLETSEGIEVFHGGEISLRKSS